MLVGRDAEGLERPCLVGGLLPRLSAGDTEWGELLEKDAPLEWLLRGGDTDVFLLWEVSSLTCFTAALSALICAALSSTFLSVSVGSAVTTVVKVAVVVIFGVRLRVRL